MNVITQRLAMNLRLAREAAGLTRGALAEKMGCHQNAVYLWETGKREMNHQSICQAADILGRSWLWFYQEQDSEAVKAGAKNFVEEDLTAQEKIVLKKLLTKFAASGDGLSFCSPALVAEVIREKSVISAGALAGRAALLAGRPAV